MVVIPDAPLPRGEVAQLLCKPESTLRDTIQRLNIPLSSERRMTRTGRRSVYVVQPADVRTLALAMGLTVAESCESPESQLAYFPQVPQHSGEGTQVCDPDEIDAVRSVPATLAQNDACFRREVLPIAESGRGERVRRRRFVGILIRPAPWVVHVASSLLAALLWCLAVLGHCLHCACWIVLRVHWGVRAADWLCSIEAPREPARRVRP